ncbi:hypothetical protein H0H93_014850 [Arthromyces matolae]|nr:hypothetical protein H0H93_014850 [Arthromyces matolae]
MSLTEKVSLAPETDSDDSNDSVVFDPKLEKTWRRIDLFVLPVVAMFYLLSFLDRTNFGNARVSGLQKDLKMSNHQYSVALTVTYVPYIVAELPSNLLLKTVGPNLMLPTMLTMWGVITALQGVVKSYGGLLACRFFLGLCEGTSFIPLSSNPQPNKSFAHPGGVFPGLVLYLSFWYPRGQLQSRFI